MRFSGKAQRRRAGFALSYESADAQTIESVLAQKHESGIVNVRKDTDTVPRLCRNPPIRFAVKARKRTKPSQ